MRLYLCEKPSQAKGLRAALGPAQQAEGCWRGDNFVVTWAVGHLLAQEPPEAYGEQYQRWSLESLPLLPTQWKKAVVARTAAQYQIVERLLKEASEVIIATDADREGEVIAREIIERCSRAPVRRLWVSDSTTAGIKKALSKLLSDEATSKLYLSGLGRERADWLAGMNLTRALTSAFVRGKGVAAFGRVQTPTLALVVRRERSIAQFVPKHYLSIAASFKLGSVNHEPIPMRWCAPEGWLDKEGHLVDLVKAKAVCASVKGNTGVISEVTATDRREVAPLLYYLGGLQKECSKRFGFSPKKTLELVQSLYQEHKAVTYPRTDCEYISAEMFAEVPDVLLAVKQADARSYGKLCDQANSPTPGRCFNSEKVAASAHHAIIPTANHLLNVDALSKDERLVYDLVVRRYVAQFLGDHVYEETVVTALCANHSFTATGRVTRTHGWREALPAAASNTDSSTRKKGDDDDDGGAEGAIALPKVVSGEVALNVDCQSKSQKTKPPKRYTEATLLTAMESIDKEISDPRLASIMKNKEKVGIGTDATRAETIATLLAREFVATEKKYLLPTDKGQSLIALLEKVCPGMVDLALTAIWEDKLAQVEKGQLSLEAFEQSIGHFVTEQIQLIRAATRDASNVIANAQGVGPAHAAPTTTTPCPTCGSSLRFINGSKGTFWGCTAHPVCKTTLPDMDGKPGARAERLTRATDTPQTSMKCPACSAPLQFRTSSSGSFWGCSSYPKCRSTLPDEDGRPGTKRPLVGPGPTAALRSVSQGRIGGTCPSCSKGKLTQKSRRDGSGSFAACTTYPECRYTQDIPV